ncbi:MAG: glycosyltransferase family 1 protein [Chloroflexi bacterium]|nr:glycosyltransferase family 1 protein [Chloroflexota bacterium]
MLGGKKTGGMNVYVRDFSRELGRQGIQVDVFTRSQDDCQPMIKHDLGHGGRVIHITAGPEEPIPVAKVANYLDEFTQGVLDFAQSENIQYDLIHSHYWLSGLVAEKLRNAWHGTPIVQMFHTLGHMKNRIAQSDSQRAPQIRIDGENHVINIADRLIAATPAEQEQLNWLYGADTSKIDIVPPGVDLERFFPIPTKEAKRRVGIPCGDTNILFAGRIEPLKGIDTMLRAMSLIQERHPEVVKNTCMAIVGGDPWADDLDEEMARLQQLRADLGIHDLVTFLGAKDQEILPNYYAAAEIVIMPSHYESFGMVALEAMAMGTPVIASEVGGLAHLVKDGINGFHIPSRDPEALAAKIYELLTNVECRIHLGEQARNYAKQYDWKNIVERMMVVYEDAARAKV